MYASNCMNGTNENSFYVDADGYKTLWDLGLGDGCPIEYSMYLTSWPIEHGGGGGRGGNNGSCSEIRRKVFYGFELFWINSLCPDAWHGQDDYGRCKASNFLRSDNSIMPIRYSYKDIKKITKQFKTELGNAGFGSIFKGQLRSGRLVAVKLLDKGKSSGKDFVNEVATIGRIHHVNVPHNILLEKDDGDLQMPNKPYLFAQELPAKDARVDNTGISNINN
ncbi:hypothetical protein TSUD_14310 [Trifolium subterraneum]|uniref:Protein kinase domain-containing protein n=1 Tax=Trifolium subterraneum TaxID=3900 RepID=A0A2Z6NAI0_TRISU|nr:hypothetical protein TSUD_14310 [Trifolium subterraneum]